MCNTQIRHYSKARKSNATGPTLSVAYTFVRNEDGTTTATYGLSQCSKNDTFDRSVGRSLAESRMKKFITKGAAKPSLNELGRLKPSTYGQITFPTDIKISVADVIRDSYLSERNTAMQPYGLSEMQELKEALHNAYMTHMRTANATEFDETAALVELLTTK